MRRAGVLLDIPSLPGPYGMGDVGPAARDFAKLLNRTGHTLWQTLPRCRRDGGGCPYSSPSSRSLDPLQVSLDDLLAEELLRPKEIEGVPRFSYDRVDPRAAAWKEPLLVLAADHFHERRPDLEVARAAFLAERPFIGEAAFFNALTKRCNTDFWPDWPEPHRQANTDALRQMAAQDADFEREVRRYETIQFLAHRQFQNLTQFCALQGVKLITDRPFYVGLCSADVWANQELFKLDASGRPTHVAGVPPDYFSATGQLWGNPVYNWPAQLDALISWWIVSLRNDLQYADMVRLDHSRAFEAYWEVPAGSPNAIVGEWQPGPRDAFLRQVVAVVGGPDRLIAEDLGEVGEEVYELLDRHDLRRMAVLQFAWGDSVDPTNPHLPQNHRQHQIVYPGTHDNDTGEGWAKSLSQSVQSRVRQDLHLAPNAKISWGLVKASYASKADTCIVPLQDHLGLGNWARTNHPGTVGPFNWSWRAQEYQLSDKLAGRMRSLARASGRSIYGTVAGTG